MELENFIFPDPEPSPPPSPESMALARHLLASVGIRASSGTGPAPRARSEDPLTLADLCDRYAATHQRTVYAEGSFWRCPNPRSPRWQRLPDSQVEAEAFFLLTKHQETGPAPMPRHVQDLVKLLRLSLAAVAAGHWDHPAGGLPLATGFLEFKTGDVHPYTAEDYVATTLPYDYVYGAEAPAWQAFLRSTIPEAAGFVQEFAGYCLTADTHLELSLWLFGFSNSGKSTLLHGLRTLLGPRAGDLSLPDLARRRTDPALLARKTLLISDEAPGDLASAGLLSSLISGEPLTLARPRSHPHTVQTRAKLALALNTLPALDGGFSSLYRRAALVVFPPRPAGTEDYDLKDRLSQEGPGLLNWALAGLRRLYRRGRFEPPDTLLAAARRLRLATNPAAAFIAERCRPDPNARTPAIVLHQAFVAFCRQHGLQPPSARALAAEWQRYGYERLHTRTGSVWCGVSLLPAAEGPPPALPEPPPNAQA